MKMVGYIILYIYTLLGTNIYPFKGTCEDDFLFPRYVSSLEGVCVCTCTIHENGEISKMYM